jgi:carbonic anhydrase/acetyltransferase-like protein (isoleucine patch superfamily)
MGVPGKVVRAVTDEDLRRTHAISANYLELAQRYARGAFLAPWARATTG